LADRWAGRQTRSAAVSIVPTTSTGAARTAGVVIPELAGRLGGLVYGGLSARMCGASGWSRRR
jgi:glyceraldehyde-3-phosphate dehydrogenase/erythrose-4-phosphate dehydrogenase